MLTYYLQTQDSLVYEIETEDVYEDFYEDKSLFDSSGHFFILSVKKLLVT